MCEETKSAAAAAKEALAEVRAEDLVMIGALAAAYNAGREAGERAQT